MAEIGNIGPVDNASGKGWAGVGAKVSQPELSQTTEPRDIAADTR